MSYDYSENILVQESVGNLLRDELGWDVRFAYNREILGKNGTFGRESYKEILLTRYFREALKKLNPWINDSQISEAQQILEQRLSTSSVLQINEEKYFLLRDGIPVTAKRSNGKTEIKKAMVFDFSEPDNQNKNYFLAIKEMKIHGDLYRRRTDIDLLRKEFAKVKKKNLVLKDLEELIQMKLDRMIFTNPERINYYERYQQIIDDYNSEQDRAIIEKIFMDLMDLANSMNQEEQRYAREGFNSDEELSLYDMLFREDLSKNDIKKLKEVAADLLSKIKNKISELDHWTDKQETKAAVDNLIRDTLWAELPECYDEVSISVYRQQIYEYVYTRYKEVA